MISPDVRNTFPILNQQVNGHPLCYLDSSNTSLTPEPVLEAMNAYYREYNANIHRGIYPISEKATAEHEFARQKVAHFIGAVSTREVVFVRNATEAINLVMQTWGRENLKEGDGVLLTGMEHHSNMVPWQLLKKAQGVELHVLPVTDDGRIDLELFKKTLQENPIKLVSIVHESNALGTINPVQEIAALAHQQGAKILVDASQSAAHMPVDVQQINSDFFVFTGHKMCGPTGIGVLHACEELLESMPPFLGGGEMIRSVTVEESTWNELPYKFEAGTPNIAGAIGLGAAIDYLQSIGMKAIHQHEQELLKEALEKLEQIPGLRIFGPKNSEGRGAIISFDLPGAHPHDIATILGERGVCVRAGNHCAQPLMEALGVAATTRMSLALYNTSQDIDQLCESLHEVRKIFSLS